MFRHIPYFFLWFTVLTALSGCTTLYTVLPNALVEPPDIVNADSSGSEIFIRSESGSNFKLVGDASARPLEINNPPELTPQTVVTGGVNFAVKNRFQYGFALAPADLRSVMGRVMLKYQIFSSENNAHMISIFGHAMGSTSHISGNQKELWGPGGYPWKASSDGWALNSGLSYGYRFTDNASVYIGGAYESFGMSAEVNQDASATGDYPAASGKLPYSKGYSRTGDVGLIWGKTKRMILNYAVGDVHWNSNVNSVHYLSVGLSFGL